jgi:cytochrome P450
MPQSLREAVDFNDPAAAADPFPLWAACRREGEVLHLPRSGGWFVFSYNAVKQALAAPEIFSNAPYRQVDAVLLGEDPPGQMAVRRIVSRHFTPAATAELEPVAARAARAATLPRFDAVQEFAQPVSRAVAGALIGFDAAALEELGTRLKEAVSQPLPVLLAALEGFGPRAAIYPQLLREGLDEAQARSLVRLLWLAATTTTERVIARCVLRLAEEPCVRQAILADRSLLGPFMEEVMRLHPPEHVLPRLCTSGTSLCGVDIPPGAPVFLCVGAANRDPAHFQSPDELRLDRDAKRHFAFGNGIHHCLGAPLARKVIAAAVGALLDAAPDLRLARPGEPPEMFASMTALAPLRVEVET